MKSLARIFYFVAGVFFILLGIVGFIVPIMPGWVFMFTGLSFIAPKFAKRLKVKFLRHFFKKEFILLDDWKIWKVTAGFTTRHFPLFLRKTDELLDLKNQKIFKSAFPRPHSRFVLLNQVHGNHVAVLDKEDQKVFAAHPFNEQDFCYLLNTDGVITNARNLTLLVFSADCLSIFFHTKGWVGLVHAGWRGTKDGIAKKAFKLIQEKSKADPKDIHVVFGPAIGADYYEVGPEFENYFTHSLTRKNNKIYFDLEKENLSQLVAAGALEENIFDSSICTVNENKNFYSFRKEKDAAGRLISFIKLD